MKVVIQFGVVCFALLAITYAVKTFQSRSETRGAVAAESEPSPCTFPGFIP